MKHLNLAAVILFYFSFFLRAFKFMEEPGFHYYAGLNSISSFSPLVLIACIVYFVMYRLERNKEQAWQWLVQILISISLVICDYSYFSAQDDMPNMIFNPIFYILYGCLLVSVIIQLFELIYNLFKITINRLVTKKRS